MTPHETSLPLIDRLVHCPRAIPICRETSGLLDAIGNTPLIRLASRERRDRLHRPRQVRVHESRREPQGPHRESDHRGGRAARNSAAGHDDPRGHQRQHRDRALDGGHGEGLSRPHHDAQDRERGAEVDDPVVRRRAGSLRGASSHAGRGRPLARARVGTPGSSFRVSSGTSTIPRATSRRRVPRSCTQTGGRIDAFVMGVGTGGTLMGVGRALRSAGARARIVAVEPDESAVMSGGPAGHHGIQGLADGFVPEIVRLDEVDEIVRVKTADAIAASHRLARGGRPPRSGSPPARTSWARSRSRAGSAPGTPWSPSSPTAASAT